MDCLPDPADLWYYIFKLHRNATALITQCWGAVMLHNTWIMFEYSILTSSGSLVELFLNICIVSSVTSHQPPGNGPPQVRPGHGAADCENIYWHSYTKWGPGQYTSTPHSHDGDISLLMWWPINNEEAHKLKWWSCTIHRQAACCYLPRHNVQCTGDQPLTRPLFSPWIFAMFAHSLYICEELHRGSWS